eukprot:349875-Chlamydomonas_euryale.AAC.9
MASRRPPQAPQRAHQSATPRAVRAASCRRAHDRGHVGPRRPRRHRRRRWGACVPLRPDRAPVASAPARRRPPPPSPP